MKKIQNKTKKKELRRKKKEVEEKEFVFSFVSVNKYNRTCIKIKTD